jgi:serine/threonine-protein kinase RsbW
MQPDEPSGAGTDLADEAEQVALLSEVSALRAENAGLRAAYGHVHEASDARGDLPADGRRDGEVIELRLPLDPRAAGAARALLARYLDDAAGLLEPAQLLVSELVTNSVRHNDARPGDAVTVSIALSPAALHIDVHDDGDGGTVAPVAPDLDSGGGFGLYLVRSLSSAWGVERPPGGGTRVWAQLARDGLSATAGA